MRRYATLAMFLALALAAGCGDGSASGGGDAGGGGAPGGSGGGGGSGGTGGDGGGAGGGAGGTGGEGGSGGATSGVELIAVQVEVSNERMCISPPCTSIAPGEELPLTARLIDVDGNIRDDLQVAWSSADESIATVDENGRVRGVRKGSVVISATAGANDERGDIRITVTSAQVMAIEVVERDVQLTADGTAQLTAVAYDELGNVLDDVTFFWSAGNPLVAEVDANGVVIGVGNGSAVILVAADRGTARGWTAVHVSGGADRPAPFDLVEIAPGGCGLQADGKAWCWGYNHFGEMGVGRRDPSTVHFPIPEPVATDVRFRSIHKAEYSACGVDLEGYAWCWGLNAAGSRGISTEEEAIGGTEVPMPVLAGTIQQLALGSNHSCAISTEGDTWCWGLGAEGAVGYGGTENQWTPVLLEGRRFTQLAAGGYHTCALDTAGKAWCWGSNMLGQLGNGAQRDGDNLGDLATPALEPVAVVGDHTFVKLTAANHTCGLTAGGEVWCWGNNQSGQIAPPEAGMEITTPRPIITEERFVDIAAGWHHTCGLTADGEVWCWGNNFSGQLGNGTMDDSVVPVQVATSLRFDSIAVHGSTSCGIVEGQGPWCWGSSYTGEMAGGFTPGYSPFPWPVAHPAPEAPPDDGEAQ